MLMRYAIYKKIWKLMRTILPDSIWVVLSKIKNFILYREQKKSWGDKHEDINFYIIRLKKNPIGLFSAFSQVVGGLVLAEKKKYVPVVDMRNYESLFLPPNSSRKYYNPWERFFKQPAGYGLQDIMGSRNIICSKRVGIETYTYKDVLNNSLDPYASAVRKWIHLNEDIEKVIDNIVNTLGINEKTLGVFCRGTDYISLKPKVHPVQPSVSELIKEVNNYIVAWNIEKVYFVTEDNSIYESFKEEVDIEVYGNVKNKINTYREGTFLAFNENKDSGYIDSPLEYLADIMILSKCGHYLGSLASGSIAAILLNDNKYINRKILYYGVY